MTASMVVARGRTIDARLAALVLVLATTFTIPGMAGASGTTDSEPDCVSTIADQPIFYGSIHRTYVLQEGLCGTANPKLVTIEEDRIQGSDFSCKASARVPGAGTGMAAFDVACQVGEDMAVGILTLDLGNAADHFRLLLPDAVDWIALYTCDNPHLLKQR